MKPFHILVVGAGSVGQRHLMNFSKLGCRVSAFDPRSGRLAEANTKVKLEQKFTNLTEAFAKANDFSGVTICSPTSYHVEQAILALNTGMPVFLEKPVGIDSKSASELVKVVCQTQIPLLLGYTYRWWPAIKELKHRLDTGIIGKPLYANCVMSAHLADWHPWEDYRTFFMASQALGGGALLDESHLLDLMLCFFGLPDKVFAQIDHLSSLEIETDDNVDAWLEYSSGLRINIHLDLFGRPHQREILVKGEDGSLKWTYDPNQLLCGKSPTAWETTPFSGERNDMFLDAAREFIEIIEKQKHPSCTINDGYLVMKVIDAMRESSISGKIVEFSKRK